MKTANNSSENVAQLKYLGMTVTYQNYMHEEVQDRLNARNICDNSEYFTTST
jgi:hypothetical protein